MKSDFIALWSIRPLCLWSMIWKRVHVTLDLSTLPLTTLTSVTLLITLTCSHSAICTHPSPSSSQHTAVPHTGLLNLCLWPCLFLTCLSTPTRTMTCLKGFLSSLGSCINPACLPICPACLLVSRMDSYSGRWPLPVLISLCLFKPVYF